MDDDVKKAITNRLTVSVDIAAKAFGIGRNAAYDAVKSGAIPSVRIGGRICVPTAPLRKMLGMSDHGAAA
jgi:excisionase family DNA binding protein